MNDKTKDELESSIFYGTRSINLIDDKIRRLNKTPLHRRDDIFKNRLALLTRELLFSTEELDKAVSALSGGEYNG